MITLTTDGAGNAANTFTRDGATTIKVEAGRRYAFVWTFSTNTPPSAGTFLPLLVWAADEPSETASFYDSTGAQISYDLATVSNGGFEFVSGVNGFLYITITGAGASKTVFANCAPIL